ncbi:hypothetical protein AAG906_033347 [Vitis piasezkii]
MARFCCACSPQSSPLTFIPKSSSNFRAFTFSATRLLSIRTPSRRPLSLTATLATVHSAEASGVDSRDKKLLLEVKDLTAVISESKQQILKGVNLVVYEGEVHAVMGKNGSGKSTFSKPSHLLRSSISECSRTSILVGGIDYEVTGFYGYISPKLDIVNMKIDFLNRNVNEGFSGGERKRNEILQLAVLGADLAILDEIDSGLDIDALKDVAKAVNGLLTRIVKTGDISIAKVLEEEGYKAISEAQL